MLALRGSVLRLVATRRARRQTFSPSGQLPRVSFVATFDVTPAIFMLAKTDNDGLDWPLWLCVLKREILRPNSAHRHETGVS